MKRILSVFLTAAVILSLCSGCGLMERFAERSAEALTGGLSADTWDSLRKSQRIELYRAGEDSPAATLDTQEELSDFVKALGLDGTTGWTLSSLPGDAEPTWDCVFYEDETVKFGQDASGRKELQLVTLRFYEQPYLTITVASIDLTFEIPETCNDYLASLAQ